MVVDLTLRVHAPLYSILGPQSPYIGRNPCFWLVPSSIPAQEIKDTLPLFSGGGGGGGWGRCAERGCPLVSFSALLFGRLMLYGGRHYLGVL